MDIMLYSIVFIVYVVFSLLMVMYIMNDANSIENINKDNILKKMDSTLLRVSLLLLWPFCLVIAIFKGLYEMTTDILIPNKDKK